MSKFGNFLKRYRAQEHISQRTLAEILDVNQASVSLWECGSTIPMFDIIVALTRLPEMPIEELIFAYFDSYDERGRIRRKQAKTS